MTKTNSNYLEASRYLKDVLCPIFKNWNTVWVFLSVVAHLICTNFWVSVWAEELYIHLVPAVYCDVRGKKNEGKNKIVLSAQKTKLKSYSSESQPWGNNASGVIAANLAYSTGIFLSSLYSFQLRMCSLLVLIWPYGTCYLHVSQSLVLLHIYKTTVHWLGWAPKHPCH